MATLICVVPRDLSGRLYGLLREHFAGSGIEVVVERRSDERRSDADRRQAEGDEAASGAEDQRRIRNAGGRRVADRRVSVVEMPAPETLPRRARRYADRLVFLERLEPSAEQVEDDDTSRLVIAVQAGDREAFSVLYSRYFDRVYGYVRLLLRDPHEAEDMAQESFMRALDALPRYERRTEPFRAWLFTIARSRALRALSDRERMEPAEDVPEMLAAATQQDPRSTEPMPGWISDSDLAIFIERLPEAQRQALFLRFALGLSAEEVGEVMGRNAEAVRQLQSRGLQSVRERMVAIGRDTRCHRSRAGRVRVEGITVLRARRFGLRARWLAFSQSRPLPSAR